MAMFPLPQRLPGGIDATVELYARPRRAPALAAEALAFQELATLLVERPDRAVRQLLDIALRLCRAGSAGISLLESGKGGPPRIRSVLAGELAPQAGGTPPRASGPCRLCLEAGATILVSPFRAFDRPGTTDPPITEGLVTPLFDTGRVALGTLWVVHHDAGRAFDAEDARIVERLAVQLVLALRMGEEPVRAGRERAGQRRALDAARAQAGAMSAENRRLAQANTTLIEGGAFLKSILDASADCIKVLDLDGHLKYMNDGGLRALEIDDFATVRDCYWPDFFTGAVSTAAAAALATARAGGTERFQVEAPTVRGVRKWWDILVTAIPGPDGRPRHILSISRDITEERRARDRQRASEERLQLALDAAGFVGTWDWDVAADHIHTDARFARLYGGGEGAEETAPMSGFLRRIHREDRRRFSARMRRAAATAGGFAEECRLVLPDGSLRWVLAQGQGYHDDAGRPVRLPGVMADITERKGVERILREAKADAEAANQAKTDFLAAVSHDLRQPVQAAALFLHILGGRGLPADARELIDKVAASLEGVQTLLAGLLDMARLEAGIVETDIRPFPVGDMLFRLGAEFAGKAQAAGLAFTVEPCNDTVVSDPRLLERILRSLLANAVKYTPAGTVTLSCRRDGGGLRIAVADTGLGIPSDKLDAIFEDFRQLANPERDRTRGLGIGLSMARRAAALLGCPMTVRSRVGEGTTFTVRVPRAREPAAAGPEGGSDGAAPGPEGATQARGLTGRRILVIEDDPDILSALGTLLGSWGMEVTPARSVEEVERILPDTAQPFEAVVADYRLPGGKTGAAAIALVKRRWNVTAVIITGDTSPERLREAQRTGCRLLHKPVAPGVLRHTLLTAMS